MYNNVGALIKKKAAFRIRVMSWIIAIIVVLLFANELVSRAFWLDSGIVDSYRRYWDIINIGRLIPFPLRNILNWLIYPLENIVLIFLGYTTLAYILGLLISIIKMFAVFFLARAYFRRKAMMLYAIGETVENVAQITAELIQRNGSCVCVPGVGYYRVEGDVIRLYENPLPYVTYTYN